MLGISGPFAGRQVYSIIAIPFYSILYLTSINNNMNSSIETPQEKKSHGGARAGSGRKKGSKNHVSIHDLLTSLETKTGGQRYEDLLVDDFLQARSEGNKDAVIKYHHLILNKVMNSLAKIEVTDSADAVAAKQQAFAEALSKFTGIKKD